MAILVTGGAGFIGSHLIAELLEQRRDVVCLDDFNDYYEPRVKRANAERLQRIRSFPLYELDIRDKEGCERVFSKHRIDVVVHLAARAGVRDSLRNPMLYEDVNCRGTLVLLELARSDGVKNFVFGSSSSVYGSSTRIPFNEEDPLPAPISPYAATKRAGELYCHVYHHLYGLPIVCLRFFTVYGPWGRPDMAVYKFTSLIHEGKPIPVYGDGSSKRDYTFCKDIVQGIIAAIDAEFKFEIFNLGDSRVVELQDMISLIEKALGKKAKKQMLPEQPGDVPITYADISKARRMLGYQPKYQFEEGLRIFTDWYLNERPPFAP
jgi:UDP-glucuronate 4-epimerase